MKNLFTLDGHTFKSSMSLALVLTAFFLSAPIAAQEITTHKDTLVVLPGQSSGMKDRLNGATDAVEEALKRLGRFFVIGRSNLEMIVKEQNLALSDYVDNNSVVQVGKILTARKALVVNLTDFKTNSTREQRTDSVRNKKGQVTRVETKTTITYHASIAITVKMVDIETGETTNSFSVTGTAQSEEEGAVVGDAFGDLKQSMSISLRALFPLNLQILERHGNTVYLSGGENLGVRKNMEFEVFRPTRTKNLGGREYTLQGESIGILRITSVEKDVSKATILRGFSAIQADFLIKERIRAPQSAYSVGMYYGKKTSSIIGQLALESSSYHAFSPGFSLGFGQGKDNRKSSLNLFNFQVNLQQKFLRSEILDLGIGEAIGIWRAGGLKDDSSHSLNGQWKFHISGGPVLNIYVTEKIVISAQADFLYALSDFQDWKWHGKLNPNDANEKAADHSARWTPSKGESKYKPAGLFFNVGLKFIN